MQFSTTDAIYTGLGASESRQIKAIYDVTSGGTTASNEFIINIASDGANQTVDFRSTRILGQLTATDVDRETTLTYEQVGAPIDGLVIHGSTGEWELNASAPAYQELTAGETKTITVTYAVRDEEGATSQNSFDIELTGTNDNPLLTGTPTTLPGGSEDTNYVVTKDQLLAGYTDADDGETDTLTIGALLGKDSSGASAGTFAPNDVNNPTQWTFAPVAHFNGTVNITYNVIDAQSGTTAASSEFNLASVNDIPTLTGTKTNFKTQQLSGTEDTEYSIGKQQLLAGYTDADNDTMSILGLSATNGVITADGENYKFTPNPDFNTDIANITLNYVISDGNGGNQIVSNTLKIDAINDKPVRTAGNVGTLFLIEDAPLTSMGLGDVDYSVGGGSDESGQDADLYGQ